MLLYCLKVHIGEGEVKHWQNFLYYFMDSPLQTLSHIRIGLIKCNFVTCCCIKPYKSSLIIFFEQKLCGKVKYKLRVTSSEVQFTSSNELQVPVHELRVPIHELRVQIYKLQVQIHELRV